MPSIFPCHVWPIQKLQTEYTLRALAKIIGIVLVVCAVFALVNGGGYLELGVGVIGMALAIV